MKRCVFCGGGPLTKEHVWPQWMRSFPGPAAFIQRSGGYQAAVASNVVRPNSSGELVEVSESRGRVAPNLQEVQVKCVCGPCNNGWMRVLEEAVAPTLRSMADGERLTLYEPAQTRLASWAYKCFLMYDQYFPQPDRVFTPSVYSQFFDTRTPQGDVRVFVGRSRSPHAKIAMWHDPNHVGEPGGDAQELLTAPKNVASSYLAAEGIFFVQHYYSESFPGTEPLRRALKDRPRRQVIATPARQTWPPSGQVLHWPTRQLSRWALERARLALHKALGTLGDPLARRE